MKNAQFELLMQMAQRGGRLASDGQAGEAGAVQERLMGWHECAFSVGDKELAAAAFRAWIWVSASFYYRGGAPMTVLSYEKQMMWGEAA